MKVEIPFGLIPVPLTDDDLRILDDIEKAKTERLKNYTVELYSAMEERGTDKSDIVPLSPREYGESLNRRYSKKHKNKGR